MHRFPFVISKRKSVVVSAPSLPNALDRILLRHPNKFIKTTYARNVAKHLKTMDLVSAHKEVKLISKKDKKVQYFVILEDSEFVVKKFDAVKPKDEVYSVWRGGVKIDEPKNEQAEIVEEVIEPVETKNKSEKVNSTKMETKTKKAKPAKKAAKKVATKKVAKKSNGTKRVFTPGKVVSISIADMIKNTKKGFVYRDPQGIIQSVKYNESRANQDYVREGMHEYKPEGKGK